MSLHSVFAYRHHAAAVQYDVVTVVKLVGLVFSTLKDQAVHRSGRAVVSAAPDLDPVASPQITLHVANVEKGHPGGQGGWVTALGPRELEPSPLGPQSHSRAA